MVLKGNSVLKNLWTVWAIIAISRYDVLSLNMVLNIGGLGLVATGETLPHSSTKTAHE